MIVSVIDHRAFPVRMCRDLNDFQLNSALGRFDGRAYEALLETTEVSVERIM